MNCRRPGGTRDVHQALRRVLRGGRQRRLGGRDALRRQALDLRVDGVADGVLLAVGAAVLAHREDGQVHTAIQLHAHLDHALQRQLLQLVQALHVGGCRALLGADHFTHVLLDGLHLRDAGLVVGAAGFSVLQDGCDQVSQERIEVQQRTGLLGVLGEQVVRGNRLQGSGVAHRENPRK
jgi:hypothetical protein